MLPDPTIYPRFVANQLLTERLLNNMVTYFDNQVRDTRIYLIGLGVFYGLDLEVSDNNGEFGITISKGMGVSSQGFLFKLEEPVVFKEYDSISLAKNTLVGNNCGELSSESKNYIVNELKESGGQPLTAEILQNKVVILYCIESNAQQTGVDRCINELNESGISVTNTIKAILMDKTDVDEFRPGGKDNVQTNNLDSLFIHRFGYQPVNGGNNHLYLSAIRSTNNFVNNYSAIFNEFDGNTKSIFGTISKAYVSAQNKFNLLFGENRTDFSNLKSTLNTIYDSSFSNEQVGLLNVQYFYDYLKDLILAYEEFSCLEVINQKGLFPDKCLFSKYLLLGCTEISSNITDLENYRTSLQRPPIEDIGAVGIEEARTLYDRMVNLTTLDHVRLPIALPFGGFTLSQEITPIRITPSKGVHLPLSDRAIPFYYKVDEFSSLRECWSPKLKGIGKENSIPCYYPSGKSAPNDFHLFYDLERYSFFRIEGHIGYNIDIALETIKNEQRRLNVPFDIQCVKLEHLDDSLEGERHATDFGDIERLYAKVKGDIECAIRNSDGLDGGDVLSLLPNDLGSFNYAEFEPVHINIFTPNSVEDCNLPVLKTLSDEYQRRKSELTPLIWFHKFAEKHPGLEHLGGVYKGGTLVLVFIENGPQGIPIVIADFCLPYSCCSNAPTVMYHINNINPRIIMNDTFCSNDKSEADVLLTPSGGILTVNGEIKNVDNYKFIPSSFTPNFVNGVAEIKIQYQVEGFSVSKTIIIEQAPDIEIDYEDEFVFEENDDGTCRLIGKKFQFSDSIGQADSGTYRWESNGNLLSDEDDFELIIPLGDPNEIIVTARKGDCQSLADITVNACPLESEFSIDIVNGVANFDDGLLIISSDVEFAILTLQPSGGHFDLRDSDGVVLLHSIVVAPSDSNPECKDKQYMLDLSAAINADGKSLTPGQVYTLNYGIKDCKLNTSVQFSIEIPAPQGPMRARSSSASQAKTSPLKTTSTKSTRKKSSTPKKNTPKPKSKTPKVTTPKKEAAKAPSDKLQNGERTLNLRRVAQEEAMKTLEEEQKLKGKSFGLAMNFFLVPGNNIKMLNQRFEEAITSALSRVKQAKDDKRKAWISVVEVLLQNYLDKQVALSPKALDEETQKMLSEQVVKMKTLKIKVNEIKKKWKGEELKKSLKAPSVNEILKILK